MDWQQSAGSEMIKRVNLLMTETNGLCCQVSFQVIVSLSYFRQRPSISGIEAGFGRFLPGSVAG